MQEIGKTGERLLAMATRGRNKPKDEKMIKLEVRCITENIFIVYLVDYLKKLKPCFICFMLLMFGTAFALQRNETHTSVALWVSV